LPSEPFLTETQLRFVRIRWGLMALRLSVVAALLLLLVLYGGIRA
jgi:hypothetical protein